MSNPKKIAFVCLHGSAKSLIAAEYMNRVAQARAGLALTATTSGPEPDARSAAERHRGGLRGSRHRCARPGARTRRRRWPWRRRITSYRSAARLPPLVTPGRDIERWDDCPRRQ